MKSSRLTPRLLRHAAFGALFVALFSTGCSEHRSSASAPTDPGSSAATLLAPVPVPLPTSPQHSRNSLTYMPLAIGNRWDYSIEATSRLESSDSPPETVHEEHLWASQIVGTDQIDGTIYFTQAEFDPRSLEIPLPDFAVRSDASGFYHLDVVYPRLTTGEAGARNTTWMNDHRTAVQAAAARTTHRAAFEAAAARVAARVQAIGLPGLVKPGALVETGLPTRGQGTGFRRGNALPGELTMLLYPLTGNMRWIVRDEPLFTRNVAGRERMDLPAGSYTTWAIEGGSELFGPNDRVVFSYATDGLVRIRGHFESEATDEVGNPVGLMIFEMDQKLTSFRTGVFPL